MYTLKAPPPPLEPSVTVERLADNSLKLSWENINTDTGFYDIYTSTSGADSLIIKVPSSTAEYTFRASSGANFDLVNNAERVGVFGTVGGIGTDQRSEPIPPLLPIVTAERLADNSIKVSWENIRTHELFIVFNLFVINGDTEAPVNFIPPGDVRSFTFSPTHDNFNQINDADRVGVSGTIDGESVDKTFADVPPEPTVTAVRLVDDSIKLTWENIRNDARYHVLITESGTDSTLFRLGSIASEFTFHIGSTHFDQVNKAERIGIAGSIGGERVDERFVAVPAPTLPTVTAVRLVDDSILVTWSNIPTDRDYDLKIIKDGAIDPIRTRIDAESFTILTTHSKFDDVNNADSIGINGIAGTSTTRPIFIPVPESILPALTVERLSDNSIKMAWKNIRSDTGSYAIRIVEPGNTITLFQVSSSTSEFTFETGNFHYTRVNAADRVGIAGNIGGSLVDQKLVNVPPLLLLGTPVLSLGEVTDTTVELVWTTAASAIKYQLFRNGTSIAEPTALTFTDAGLTPKTVYIYHVTAVNIVDTVSDSSNVLTVTTLVPPDPSVTAERQDDNSILVTWEGIPTTTSYFVASDVRGTATLIEQVPSSPYTILTSHTDFDQINSASRIKVNGVVDGTPGAPAYAPVPAQVTPSVTPVIPTVTSLPFEYNEFGHTVVSFTPLTAGDYTISYDIVTGETAVDPVTVTVIDGKVGTIVTATLLTDFGYVGEAVASFGGTEHVRESVQVPPAPPTLGAETITATSIQLSWDESRSATEYVIYEDGTRLSTTSALTYTHTSLTPQTEYTYTIQSRYGTNTSTISAELAVTTPAAPTLTVERLADNSVKLTWENIATENNFYNVVINSPTSSRAVQIESSDNTYTFSTSNANTHLINGATHIGVGGYDLNGGIVNDIFEPVLPPVELAENTSRTATAKRLENNSLRFSWDNIRNDAGYQIRISNSANQLISRINVSGDSYIVSTSHHRYDAINTAGNIVAISGFFKSQTVDTTRVSIPPLIPAIPTLAIERLDDNSVKLTWKNIDTDDGDVYSIRLTESGTDSTLLPVPSDTSRFTFDSSHDDFKRVSDAQRVGVHGTVDGVRSDQVWVSELRGGDESSKDGNSDKWEKKPTFGNSWSTQTQLVDAGFVFNGIPLTITDNWHTDFSLTSSVIGENNIVHIKGYASNDFKSVTLSLGIPEIGKKYDAESHIILNLNRNYTTPSDYQIMEILHDQKEGLVNESLTGATLSKAKCTPADVMEQCIDFEISFTMMAPLKHEVLAISAMDTRYRETVTFINQGVEFVGESLLESQTHVLTQKYSNQHPVETIELTQLDRRYQMWEDQNSYLWTQNEYGSWLQITMPDVTQRDDPATSVMTRNHSNFAGMITQEEDRATLVFNSLEIQGIPDEPFAHDIPLRLEKLSDPEVLEILHIQALLAEELLCDCIIFED